MSSIEIIPLYTTRPDVANGSPCDKIKTLLGLVTAVAFLALSALSIMALIPTCHKYKAIYTLIDPLYRHFSCQALYTLTACSTLASIGALTLTFYRRKPDKITETLTPLPSISTSSYPEQSLLKAQELEYLSHIASDTLVTQEEQKLNLPPAIVTSSFLPSMLSEELAVKRLNCANLTESELIIDALTTHITLDYRRSKESMGFNPVIMSKRATLHLKESNGDAILNPIYTVGKLSCEGAPLSKTAVDNQDNAIKKHLIYHLMHDHKMPAHSETLGFKTEEYATKLLNTFIISSSDFEVESLHGEFVETQNKIFSLEAGFNSYFEQLRNEFHVYEILLTQGYLYSFDLPPKEAPLVLHFLFILAFKHFYKTSQPKQCKGIVIYDEKSTKLLSTFISKEHLLNPSKQDSSYSHYALVCHKE